MHTGMQADVKIVRDSGDGRGVAFLEGMAVFVPRCLPGETVRVRIVQARKNHALADLLEILEPSTQRVTPPCPHFGICGGCAMQHMSYPQQLQAKQDLVGQCLQRIGGVAKDGYRTLPIAGMEEPWRYRNKAIWMIRQGKVGFNRLGSRDVVDIGDCLLLPKEFSQAAGVAKRLLAKEANVRSLMLRQARDGGLMAVISTVDGHLRGKEQLVSAMRAALPALKGILHGAFTPDAGEAIGRECRVLWGEERLADELCGMQLKISPHSFAQVNREQTARLYDLAVEAAGLTGKERVVDAYCGAGVLTQLLAGRAKRVTGIELVPSAVRDAVASAERNGCDNVSFMQGACERILPTMTACPDVVVLDPPRKGCDESVLAAVANLHPEKIVYVSCDPSTLARDVKRLSEKGYRLSQVQAVDMFPWTVHVETVAQMTRPER